MEFARYGGLQIWDTSRSANHPPATSAKGQEFPGLFAVRTYVMPAPCDKRLTFRGQNSQTPPKTVTTQTEPTVWAPACPTWPERTFPADRPAPEGSASKATYEPAARSDPPQSSRISASTPASRRPLPLAKAPLVPLVRSDRKDFAPYPRSLDHRCANDNICEYQLVPRR
jgi:hypothetical protein